MEAKVKKLENEVIVLRDELAKMKRFYEDLLYNLDDDNFSGKFIKEKNGMKTAISVTEEEISILTSETKELGTKVSEIEVTAEGISTKVEEKYKVITDDVEEKYNNLSSQITQTADSIKSEVSANYETKGNASENYANLSSSIQQTAEEISTKVSANQFESYFKQTANGFTFDGNQTRFSGVIYLTDSNLNNKFSVFYDASQGYEQIFLHSVATDENGNAYSMPIVIGDGAAPQGLAFETDVFIGSASSGNEVATRGWVKANPQPAVFG